MQSPDSSQAAAPPTENAGLAPLDVALLADLTKGLNDLAAQLQADREQLRKGTARVVAMEKDLTRFQTLTQDPSQDPAGSTPPGPAAAATQRMDPPSSTAPPLHVCGTGCSHYAFHEAASATHTVAQQLAQRHVPDVPSDAAQLPRAIPAPDADAEAEADAQYAREPPIPDHAPARDAQANIHAPPKAAYLALSWFDQLMDHVPPEGIHAFLDFYGQVAWIDPTTQAWLARLADGVSNRGAAAPLDSLVPDPAELARLHRANLKVLERMSAQDLGPDTVRRLQRDLRRTLGDRPSKAR